MSVCRWLVLFLVGVVVGRAQMPIRDPDQIKSLNAVLDNRIDGDPLKCEVQTFRPFLDFAFRFEAGHIVRCPLAQFEGRDSALAAYLRIRPEGGTAAYLGEAFRMPEMPAAMRANYVWKRMHDEAEFSGVFAAGPGQYAVDLMVVDDRRRTFRKSWQVKISAGRSERKAAIAIEPNTVASAAIPPWHSGTGQISKGGPQLTVFLDAAPVFPSSQKLRAWDRAFLLSSLASLLRGIQPSSVRLVAFNLEQQKEVYHEETFNREQFPKLGEALRRLELGSVSYKALEAHSGWSDLLTRMVYQEAHQEKVADAVVFLGPNVRNMNKIPKELLACDSLSTKVHYLEFFPVPGSEFPDTIHQLTNTCGGNVYRMHSPNDLADAILKLQSRIVTQP